MDQNVAKSIAIVVLFVTTIVFGCFPYFLVRGGVVKERSVRIRKQIISGLNCFAGGVFLGACLLQLLAEGSETMNEYFDRVHPIDFPVFNTLVACGLFIIAAIEMLIHHILHSSDSHQDASHGVQDSAGGGTQDGLITNPTTYGATKVEVKNTGVSKGSEIVETGHAEQEIMEIITSMNATPLKAFLLLGALSFHTIFDGLAVGLQTSGYGVWQMFVAILIHKCLVAVCLGLQLFMVFRDRFWVGFLWIFFFALIAPVGIGIGMGLTSGSIDELAEMLASSILQALATGTFLYVSFFEILKDELVERRGFFRLMLVVIGFGAMALAKALDKD